MNIIFFEIWWRIRYIWLTIIACLITSYFYSEQIIYILSQPLDIIPGFSIKNKWIFTELTEAFYAHIKVALFVTIYILLLILPCHIYMFIRPGLHEFENYKLLNWILMSFTLSLFNLAITYILTLPILCQFFLNYEILSIGLHLEARVSTYLNLIFFYLFACNLIIQLPIALLLIDKFLSNNLWEKRKLTFIITLLLAFFINPWNDIIGQIITGIILISLNEIVNLVLINTKIRKVWPKSHGRGNMREELGKK